jgi:hypothetical protein
VVEAIVIVKLGQAKIICLKGRLHRDKKRHDVGAIRGTDPSPPCWLGTETPFTASVCASVTLFLVISRAFVAFRTSTDGYCLYCCIVMKESIVVAKRTVTVAPCRAIKAAGGAEVDAAGV